MYKKVVVLESIYNPTIKWLRMVIENPKKEGLMVFEGDHLFIEALKSKNFFFSKVFLTPKKFEEWKDYLMDIDYVLVSEQLFEKISLNKTPQGLMVVGKLQNFVLQCPSFLSSFLYLDRVQDPVNVGILIRSAFSFSFDAVFLGEGSADFLNPTVIARSAGSIFHIPVFKMKSWEFLNYCKFNDVKIVVADIKGEEFFSELRELFPFALVLGNEARGVDDSLKKEADYFFKIKMREGWDSLNVAVAGSILMYNLKKNFL